MYFFQIWLDYYTLLSLKSDALSGRSLSFYQGVFGSAFEFKAYFIINLDVYTVASVRVLIYQETLSARLSFFQYSGNLLVDNE